jgi:hypothetical protein
MQHAEDTGVYGATGDGAIYGDGPGTLLLSRRSALDLLDKIAVVASEHFATGLKPEGFDFSSYWRDAKKLTLRPKVTTRWGDEHGLRSRNSSGISLQTLYIRQPNY